MAYVGVSGVAGKMGRTLIQMIHRTDDLTLRGAFEHPDNEFVGSDAGSLAGVGNLDVDIRPIAELIESGIDVMIDFSVPQATLSTVEKCVSADIGIVIGTTGFEAAELKRIGQAAEQIPILMAPNMSVGVNVAFKLIEVAAQILGDTMDVEVYEMHHRHKVDAPSGTAVKMGEILAETLGRSIKDDAVYGRVGTAGARDTKIIGFHSARGGDVVGDHTTTFAGTGERIEITHRAQSRDNFAAGAMLAAAFIEKQRVEKSTGLFDMADVLGI